MDSMGNHFTDLIVRADFSSETDFKDVLRTRLFKNKENKKSGVLQFQRLSDMDLDMVSAAGDQSLMMQRDQNILGGQKEQ